MKAGQRQWARRQSLAIDERGYAINLSDNLFQPVSTETLGEFNRGSGGELRRGRAGGLPKLHALHSSAALACNVFDYWWARDVALLEAALGVPSPSLRTSFEAPFPTGLSREPPNLDFAFFLRSGAVWAVESKFTEPYCGGRRAKTLQDKYFETGDAVWTRRMLPRCGQTALRIREGDLAFRHLDAPQLLKHALGLHAAVGKRFTLCYLYVDATSPEGEDHRAELAAFTATLAAEIDFRAMAYDELVRRLRALAGPYHDPYFNYLRDRYGLDAAA